MPFTPRLLLLLLLLSMTLSPFGTAPARAADSPIGYILGGSLNSPIRIEVFSNFQCGACRVLFLETIQPILREYSSKDKVCVIYYEFPLSYFPLAHEAARYSEAASRMGLSTLLRLIETFYLNQDDWGQSGDLAAAAAKVLSANDMGTLRRIMQDPGINDAVEKHYRFGMQKNIGSTPTMFITYPGRNQKVEGVVSYQVMKRFLDSILK
ncbi:MAG TPA: thioredoxin domain-containing protein [Acidobacteriota bacterium]|nr:thioredoxin domain-containing protein [Acidobacteriota bacterium]